MSTYIKPKIKNLQPKSLIETIGPVVTAYGSLTIDVARKQQALNGHKSNIVIAKIIQKKQSELVKIG